MSKPTSFLLGLGAGVLTVIVLAVAVFLLATERHQA